MFSAYQTLNHVAAVPRRLRAGFASRYLRVFLMLATLLLGALAAGALTVVVTALPGLPEAERAAAALGSAVVIFAVLLLGARLLLARPAPVRALWPAAALGAAAVTVALNLGAPVLARLVSKAGPVYGSFATVAGMFALLYLVNQALVYAAEVAAVRERLWPRALDVNRPDGGRRPCDGTPGPRARTHPGGPGRVPPCFPRITPGRQRFAGIRSSLATRTGGSASARRCRAPGNIVPCPHLPGSCSRCEVSPAPKRCLTHASRLMGARSVRLRSQFQMQCLADFPRYLVHRCLRYVALAGSPPSSPNARGPRRSASRPGWRGMMWSPGTSRIVPGKAVPRPPARASPSQPASTAAANRRRAARGARPVQRDRLALSFHRAVWSGRRV